MADDAETIACTPLPVDPDGFNPNVILPYGCTSADIYRAMKDFVDFLGFVNEQLHEREIARLETMIMSANFSSMVSEFMVAGIAKYSSTLIKNRYHNGHPDLIPRGWYPEDAAQHAPEGIEIKASRHAKGWQGHNPEDVWLMIFIFDSNSNRGPDEKENQTLRPFGFRQVLGARLVKEDWRFSGRSETSRRTITASVTDSGYKKAVANWIYRAPVSLLQGKG